MKDYKTYSIIGTANKEYNKICEICGFFINYCQKSDCILLIQYKVRKNSFTNNFGNFGLAFS